MHIKSFSRSKLSLVVGAIIPLLFLMLFPWAIGSSPWGSVRFFFTVIFFLFIPGLFFVNLLKLGLDGLEKIALSLTLGIVASNIMFTLAHSFRIIPLYLLLPFFSLTALIYFRFKKSHVPHDRKKFVILPYLLVFAVVVICLIPLKLLPLYSNSYISQPDGGVQLYGERDGILHMAIANELTHTFPPQVPFFSGEKLNYHFGMDLLAATFSRFSGTSTPDTVMRFLPVLFIFLAIVTIFCLARRWLDSTVIAALIAFLTIMGEDFSFIPGALFHSKALWNVKYFQVPTVFSLYFLNPMLPALALFFNGLFCLYQYFQEKKYVWLLLAGLHFSVMGTFKVFLTIQVLFSLMLMTALYIFLRDTRALKAFLITLFLSIALFAFMGRQDIQGSISIWLRLDLFTDYIPTALKNLRLENFPIFSTVTKMYQTHKWTSGGLLATLAFAMPLYFIGSSGLRILGLPYMLRSLFTIDRARAIKAFTALFVVVGFFLTLFLKITPKEHPGDYNNAVWFYVQSKYMAWIFAGETIRRFFKFLSYKGKIMTVILVVILAVPSSVQFFNKIAKLDCSYKTEKEAAEVVNFLKKASRKGAVVLSNNRYVSELLLVYTGLRIPYLDIFAISFVSDEKSKVRLRDWTEFWEGWNHGRLRRDLADKYAANYVVSSGDTDQNTLGTTVCFENRLYQIHSINGICEEGSY